MCCICWYGGAHEEGARSDSMTVSSPVAAVHRAIHQRAGALWYYLTGRAGIMDAYDSGEELTREGGQHA